MGILSFFLDNAGSWALFFLVLWWFLCGGSLFPGLVLAMSLIPLVPFKINMQHSGREFIPYEACLLFSFSLLVLMLLVDEEVAVPSSFIITLAVAASN